MSAAVRSLPLYVDLDGTLIFSDCLYESFLRLLRLNPLSLFMVLVWLIQGGRAYMKQQISERAVIDVTTLPYNEPLIAWLRAQKADGRQIILATASHHKYAEAIARHLDVFDRVLASDKDINLKGINKSLLLVRECGAGGFDYAGDSKADFHVWSEANAAVVVSRSRKFVRSVEKIATVDQQFNTPLKFFSLAALRPHQWLKNVLLFVPLLTSHHLLDGSYILSAVIAFISFSLCASSVYILNDLLDLEADRLHPRKQHRPFASGKASLPGGIVMLVCLLLTAFLIATWVGHGFLKWLAFYYSLTVLYSLYLKRVKMVDILVLASLYTIRIIAGAAAITVPLSNWLLAFSMFFFLSLSLVKRYADLVSLRAEGLEGVVPGRQYHLQDSVLILWSGLISGFLSVLVFGGYIMSDDVLTLYSQANLLWFAVPLLSLWVSRVWWAAHQGDIHSDPVLFVVEDHFSQITLLLLILTVWIAT